MSLNPTEVLSSTSFECPPTPRPSGAWDRSDYVHYTNRLESALMEISKQYLSVEMDDHTREHTNWEAGYEQCVKVARASLGFSENADVGAPKSIVPHARRLR